MIADRHSLKEYIADTGDQDWPGVAVRINKCHMLVHCDLVNVCREFLPARWWEVLSACDTLGKS